MYVPGCQLLSACSAALDGARQYRALQAHVIGVMVEIKDPRCCDLKFFGISICLTDYSLDTQFDPRQTLQISCFVG
ncbi:hypothetical protein M441DRAFT_266803 [Trichoderma asperellum CBS 433.97]|uniref:Uncharacterized protein n=1 Tax=Trichoderma asperellum (strain ATCC 204424 / CBS 433.97 / NBRC 101777) TaxID=1042311 RepID=A0A2T3YY12_TRIA4|nr:hypothetical protein M441DRAFT_266803 [Trichoderma asperellum CBS 433.97]PTB37438.1 hypothetical protein M441DRAFT_266803 [Trichoderma asperellum CBS 433.97]